MTNMSLGRLQRVELRDIWLCEASDFTPWLARKENLDNLGQTLGIDLELEAQERPVGPFRADILAGGRRRARAASAAVRWRRRRGQLGGVADRHRAPSAPAGTG
jgi:hypothetical protein